VCPDGVGVVVDGVDEEIQRPEVHQVDLREA